MERLRAILADATARWQAAELPVRAGILAGGGALAGLVVLVVVLAVTGSFVSAGEDDDLVATPPATETAEAPDPATSTATPTPRPTRTRTPTPSPTPTEDPGPPTIRNLGTFTQEYGEPPGASFARLRIPVLGVDAGVSAHHVGAGSVMTAPQGPNNIAWYELEPNWPGMGGRPGEGKNAIFSGHVDYAGYVPFADVRYSGKAVFGDLQLLSPGDVIEVLHNGQVLQYQVVWNRQLSANGTNWGEIWSSNVGADSITLYTCGGDFDFQNLTYSDRIVVRAERI